MSFALMAANTQWLLDLRSRKRGQDLGPDLANFAIVRNRRD
jgi:hypothetical protein